MWTERDGVDLRASNERYVIARQSLTFFLWQNVCSASAFLCVSLWISWMSNQNTETKKRSHKWAQKGFSRLRCNDYSTLMERRARRIFEQKQRLERERTEAVLATRVEDKTVAQLRRFSGALGSYNNNLPPSKSSLIMRLLIFSREWINLFRIKRRSTVRHGDGSLINCKLASSFDAVVEVDLRAFKRLMSFRWTFRL